MDELQCHNRTLEDNVHNIRQCQQKVNPPEEVELLDLYPLSKQIRGANVSEGFKLPSLSMFDGHNNPYEHVASINTQMAIIGAQNSPKCKLLSGTLREVALRWYTNIPRACINNYQELEKKQIYQFSASCPMKMSTKFRQNR